MGKNREEGEGNILTIEPSKKSRKKGRVGEGGSRGGREQEREGEGVGGGTQRMGGKDKKNHRRRDRVERRGRGEEEG